MRALRPFSRPLALGLAVLTFWVATPAGGLLAAMIPTDQSAADAAAAATARDTLRRLVSRQEVREALAAQGIDPAEAARRVESLTDAEARRLAARLEQLPAGQGAVEVVLAVALVLFLVLLITDLTGVTDVFPWVK